MQRADIWKDPDAGKDWRYEKNGTTEDEMVGWHHRLIGHEFDQALGAGDGQGGLACCSPWDHKELDTTKQLNWTESQQEWGPQSNSSQGTESYQQTGKLICESSEGEAPWMVSWAIEIARW